MGTVSGDKQIAAALNRMAKGPTTRVVDAAANRAMRPMRDDARKRIKAHRNYAAKYPSFFPNQRPERFKGNSLDKGIIFRKDGKQTPGQRSYKLGGDKRARWLLSIFEFGTSPHWQGRLLGGWMHPGSTPRPSMVPAYEHGKEAVIDVMQEEMLMWAEREARAMGMRFTRGR